MKPYIPLFAYLACLTLGRVDYRNYEKGDNYPDNPAVLTIQCQTRNNPPCYVAVNSDSDPNTVIGFIVVTIDQQLSKEVENAVRRKMKKPKAKGIFGFIHQVAVAKDSQGKGIGTRLLDYMINLGKSTPNFLAMVLYVDHNNLGAIKLYKRDWVSLKSSGLLESYCYNPCMRPPRLIYRERDIGLKENTPMPEAAPPSPAHVDVVLLQEKRT
ncbi:hypothetical protein FOL47_010578 [Perkinsus chesapeaki]|uniref:N-acetyltransferase domain-containing protein n=1 Tax=Perkinsus chesapeaki TaxID=330153 RepID=A0A7J6MPV0_PERCH|nr:hypothetical protein FOL47_010578 [Perkinsus chesapeaki]